MKNKTLAVALITITLFSQQTKASLITGIASLIEEFTNAGFQAPLITKIDTETNFQLSIQGLLVDHTLLSDDASFSETFQFDFWRGTLAFSQTDGIINPDTVTAGASIFHQARPHPSDSLQGGIFTVPAKALVQGDAQYTFSGIVDHPLNHKDKYDGFFSVTGASDNITGWTFVLNGRHVPEPSTLLLFLAVILIIMYLKKDIKLSTEGYREVNG